MKKKSICSELFYSYCFNKFALLHSVVFVCLSISRGQNGETQQWSEKIIVEENDWAYETHYMNGNDWYVSTALTGNVQHVSYVSGSEFYDFRLGEQEKRVVDIPEYKNEPSLSYVKTFKISETNGVWNADFHRKCNENEGEISLMIAQMIVQCLQLSEQKEKLFEGSRRKIVPDGWSDDMTTLKLYALEDNTRKVNIVSWEDESGQDDPVVWWTFCVDRDAITYLRIEHLRGSYKSKDKLVEFVEYVNIIRNEFISKNITTKSIRGMSEEVRVDICTIHRSSGGDIASYRDKESVRYDLSKEEMDVLLREYGRDHPKILEHLVPPEKQ